MKEREPSAPARRGAGMRRIIGWLFDLYPSAEGITVWIVDDEGRQHRCSTPFTPSFFMHVQDSDAAKVAALTRSLPMNVTFEWDRQREIYANQEWTVLRVRVHDTRAHLSVVKHLERHFPHYAFFNSDIPSQQLFLYETGLFPLARGEYEITQDGLLARWALSDSADAVEYAMPPLTTMVLRNRADFVSPKYRKTCQLEVAYDGRTFELEQQEPAALLEGLNRHLRACDPDIILTQYGDAVLLPMLARLAADERVPLPLNRDERAGYFTTNASSYFTYGRIVHKDGAFELAGRWHLDTENSFMMGEASLEGVAEIARMTQLPVQHQSRCTIGSALSSMQLSWAMRHNYLIPAKKREPEAFKSAATLLLADRGGLIFQPVMGYHEQIAELDFVSMYPTIMVEHNVSPETVNCRCCDNRVVPELGYTICERREGIVPSTLRTVVRKRGLYKKQKKQLKAAGDPRWTLYDRRQNALKWMLVTCFGYLGYKNARFGRIEAHESVNAYSRDAILRAKEMAERRGTRSSTRSWTACGSRTTARRTPTTSGLRPKSSKAVGHRHLPGRDLQVDPVPVIEDGPAHSDREQVRRLVRIERDQDPRRGDAPARHAGVHQADAGGDAADHGPRAVGRGRGAARARGAGEGRGAHPPAAERPG